MTAGPGPDVAKRGLPAGGWPLLIFVAGVGAAGLVAASVGIRAMDTVTVLTEAVLGAALAGLLATAALVLLRRSRVAVQATIAALAPVAAVAIGVTWATSGMFITGHDLKVLWIVLVAAGAVGMAVSLILAQRVSGAARTVGRMARQLGEAGPVAVTGPVPPPGPAVPGELAALEAELRRTSGLLADARVQAEAVERSRRELVAWVSHDLRTPLAGIRAMVEALEDRVVTDGPTVDRYHATIRLEADRLAGLVDDLFEWSRIQAGSLALHRRPVAIDDLLADAVAGAGVAAAARGVELHVAAGAGLPLAEVSAAECIRVVRNLLDNAIRHTPPGGRVTVEAGLIGADPDAGRTGAGGPAVEISVIDGCGGIPAEDIHRVFELGYRGDPARTPGSAGGGLGLAVAQGLVEAHSGQITVANVAGGCRFTVRLPLRPGDTPPS